MVDHRDGVKLVDGRGNALAFDLRQAAGLNAESGSLTPNGQFPATLEHLGERESALEAHLGQYLTGPFISIGHGSVAVCRAAGYMAARARSSENRIEPKEDSLGASYNGRRKGDMVTRDERAICGDAVRRILEAAHFAAQKHAGQRRKGHAGEPYVNHLIEVAELIAGSTPDLDVNLVMAGFLHDTIEDTGVTAGELERHFGGDVTALVLEATDDKSLPKEMRKALQVTNASSRSPRAQTLKLADKISNLRSLLTSPPVEWSEERKRQYFEWARQVVSGFTAPNALLKSEFDKTYALLGSTGSAVRS
jgi:hypothetical protein